MNKEIINAWLSEHKSSTLPGFLKRNPAIKDWVVSQTSQYTTKNIMESVFIILNGPQPVCEFNNPKQFNTFDLGYRKGCILGNKCRCISNIRMEVLKDTLQSKYGVDNANYIPGVDEKRKNTMISRLGTPYATQSAIVKEKHRNTIKNKTEAEQLATKQKRIQTFNDRYGVDHHMKLESQKEKLFLTNMKKYNGKVPMQNEEIRAKAKETNSKKTQKDKQLQLEKTKQTLTEKYGVYAPSRIGISQDVLDILDSKEKLIELISGKTRKEVLATINVAPHTLYLYSKKYDIQDLYIRDMSSVPETEINEFIKSLGYETEIGNRTILNGKEIDIFIPDLRIAVEYGGLYYHSERAGRGKTYHYDKYKNCLAQGITLITIFGDEWDLSQYKVKHRLTHILNKTPSKIHARKCKIETITSKIASAFINKYHLQGSVSASINYGLFYESNLIAVMNFSKSRFNKKFQYEILRFCSSANVIGGASKLFKHFIKQYNPESVLSYSDNRWGNGKVYVNLGMKKENETIGFYYTDYHKRYNREKFQKHKLVEEGHDPNLTAKEIMQNKNYDIIWDCGQSLWTWNKYNINEVI